MKDADMLGGYLGFGDSVRIEYPYSPIIGTVHDYSGGYKQNFKLTITYYTAEPEVEEDDEIDYGFELPTYSKGSYMDRLQYDYDNITAEEYGGTAVIGLAGVSGVFGTMAVVFGAGLVAVVALG
jgi:hypothetical protein